MNLSHKVRILLIIPAAAALTMPLQADPAELNFENHTTNPSHENGGYPTGPIGGTFNFYRLDGGWDLSVCPSVVCALISGQQIPLAFVEADDTPVNEGMYPVSRATNLSFRTGAYTGTDAGGNLHFGPGGWLRIYGTVLGGEGQPIAGPTLLLNGTFDQGLYEVETNRVTFTTSQGFDSKNQKLVHYFFDHDPAGWYFRTRVIGVPDPSLHQTLAEGGVPVWDAEITNIENPEPGSVLLLGTALLAFTTMARRRARAR